MALYEILGVSCDATVEEIEAAVVSCRERLRHECPPEKLEACLEYMSSVKKILTSNEGRACYDNIESCRHSYVSPLRGSLILKRVYWYNLLSDVGFGNTFTEHLRRFASMKEAAPLLEVSGCVDLKCRWCDEALVKGKMSTVICNCDSRTGHPSCVQKFMYTHKRCPVCRTKLLLRNRVSKYMLFCKNPKYIVR